MLIKTDILFFSQDLTTSFKICTSKKCTKLGPKKLNKDFKKACNIDII